MKKAVPLLTLLGTCLGFVLSSAPAQAQATRTWISGVGDDVNPCSRTAPCKTFPGAISKTAVNGIINCLDPGGFGGVTITKSITLDCRNVLAGLLVAGGNAINIPTNNIVVNLRGLDIEGDVLGLVGVNITGAGCVVHIEDSKIYGFQSGAATGINYAPSAAGGTLILTNTHIHSNGTGVIVSGNTGAVNMSMRDVVVDNNSSIGVSVTTTASHAGATIDRSLIAFNTGTGVKVNGAAAVVLIGNSTITGNGTGVSNTGGTLQSFKNNQIAGNVTDGTPITAFPGPGPAPLQ